MFGAFGDLRATRSQGGTQKLCHTPTGSPGSPKVFARLTHVSQRGLTQHSSCQAVMLITKPWSPNTWSLPPIEGSLPMQDRHFGCHCAR